MKISCIAAYTTVFVLVAVCLPELAGGVSPALADQETAVMATPAKAVKITGINDREALLAAIGNEEVTIVVSADLEIDGPVSVSGSRPLIHVDGFFRASNGVEIEAEGTKAEAVRVNGHLNLEGPLVVMFSSIEADEEAAVGTGEITIDCSLVSAESDMFDSSCHDAGRRWCSWLPHLQEKKKRQC